MEKEKKYTPLLIIEEASRCLLCYDASCSKACPAKTNPARFIRAVRFRNFKGAVEIVREIMLLEGFVQEYAQLKSYVKVLVQDVVLISQLILQ